MKKLTERSYLLLREFWFNLKVEMQGRRKKKLFWVSAIAPLISVILSTLIVFVSRADKHGVKIVKEVKKGLNPISIHQLQLNSSTVGLAAKAGLIAALIALTVEFTTNLH